MTRASSMRPTRRVLTSRSGDDYVVELYADRVVLRPKGSRRNGPAEVVAPVGPVYIRLLRERLDHERQERRSARKKKRR